VITGYFSAQRSGLRL